MTAREKATELAHSIDTNLLYPVVPTPALIDMFEAALIEARREGMEESIQIAEKYDRELFGQESDGYHIAQKIRQATARLGKEIKK